MLRGGSGEYEEKKSRFIGELFPVKTEEDAVRILAEVRKKYYDARHHCYAYILGADGGTSKCADDGEPQKTAGYPILSVLQGEHLTDALIVVTRYFGGTLLGTGGLVRAYTNAAKEAVLHSEVMTKIPAEIWRLAVPYTLIGRMQSYAAENALPVKNTVYEENVLMDLVIPVSSVSEILSGITDLSQGRAILNKSGECFFAASGREILYFDD